MKKISPALIVTVFNILTIYPVFFFAYYEEEERKRKKKKIRLEKLVGNVVSNFSIEISLFLCVPTNKFLTIWVSLTTKGTHFTERPCDVDPVALKLVAPWGAQFLCC